MSRNRSTIGRWRVSSLLLLCVITALVLCFRSGAADPPAPVRPSIQTGPGQRTFFASADTTVMEGIPRGNRGAYSEMWVGYDASSQPPIGAVRGLVRFDLSTLPRAAEIESARLRLYLTDWWDRVNPVQTITVYTAASAWSEMEVTWSDAPDVAEACGSQPVPSGQAGWYEWDVTALAQTWHSASQSNLGLVLRGDEAGGRRGFSAREGSQPPELVVDYQEGSHFLYLPAMLRKSLR